MKASRRRLLRALTLPVLAFAALLLPAVARAANSGDGAGFGPVLGFTTSGSVSLGWELSGSFYATPLLRVALGGSYHLVRAGDDPRYFHYLALEPWIYVGATLGVAAAEQSPKILYGLWAGWAQDLGAPLLDGNTDFVDDDTRFHWVFSLAIGWRGLGTTQQFYVTPKIWRLKGWDFFT